jgi:pilus assembly protein CpaE
MVDGKLRGAFEALALELDMVPRAEEAAPEEPRGLLARLGGERGQTSAEFMGILPAVVVVFLALWQIALIGLTYVSAGHAANDGARKLATNPSDAGDDPPYRQAALEDLGPAWRKGAVISKQNGVTVSVSLKVPLLIPGLRTPFTIHTTADTSVEDQGVPPRQGGVGL